MIISKLSSRGTTTWIEHELNASEESQTDQSKRWGVAKCLSQIVTQPIVSPCVTASHSESASCQSVRSAKSGLSISSQHSAKVTDKVTEITDVSVSLLYVH